MELLEEELTCPVCCGLFDDPRLLPCSHSFCRRCLEGLLEEGPRTPARCPTCRREVAHKQGPLHQGAPHSLQVNYSLRGIVEKYRRTLEGTLVGTLEGTRGGTAPRGPGCPTHGGQPLNIYCAADRRLICGFCATAADHRGHELCALDEACRRERDTLEGLSRGMDGWREGDMVSRLESLEAGRTEALRGVSGDARRASEYLEKLVGALETKKLEVLRDLETLKQAVMDAYEPEISRLTAALDAQNRALGIAASFRDLSGSGSWCGSGSGSWSWSGCGSGCGSGSESESLGFLQQMQEFREQLRVVRAAASLPEVDVVVGPHLSDSDLRKWDSLRLRDVDQISVRRPLRATKSSSSSSCWPRVPKLFFLSMSLLLPAVFLLHPDTLCATPAHLSAHTEALLTHLLTHLPYLPTHLLGAAQQVGLEVVAAVSGFLQDAWGHLEPSDP